jgi:threonine dehydratase
VPPPVDDRVATSEVEKAVRRVARRTPLLALPELSERLGRPTFVKAECLQLTGSFKVRGAVARLSALTEEERSRGVVACSSGNHGRAVAYVAERFGIPATVCVPEWVDTVKLDGIRARGAETLLVGASFDVAEAHAVALARETGRVYVSAYDDPWVIAGQGTVAGEILEQLGEVPAAVLTPLSGGGLVGGMAAAFRAAVGPVRPRMVAVSAENAAVMLASVRAGTPVELPELETLANALAGGIGGDNRYSFEMVRTLVDEHRAVSEAEIAAAMAYAAGALRLVVEGGGAVALAALLQGRWAPPEADGPVVVVLSGGNVALATLASVLG